MNLNQVTVPVTDVARSIVFYQRLGLKLIVESLPHYARFECGESRNTFSLHQVNEKPSGENAWIYFEINTLDETVTSLQKDGFVFETLPENKPWLWREVRLRDPDGNLLILYFAGENRLYPPWRIN
jgi:catechol 2,3-dioxygenase-like lactoylglutathione lyase family enzyme